MVNTVYLEQPLTKPCEKQLDVLGPEYEEISRHIGRANYVEAALVVERLFQQGVYDVRLLGYFLFGVFSERQIAGLPVIIECLILLLRESLPCIGPDERKEQQLDSALRWLFGKVVQHVEHYKRDKDPRYEQWQKPEYADVRQAALRDLQRLEEVLPSVISNGRAHQTLRHVRTLLQGMQIDASEASPFPVSAIAELQEREERLVQLAEESTPSDVNLDDVATHDLRTDQEGNAGDAPAQEQADTPDEVSVNRESLGGSPEGSVQTTQSEGDAATMALPISQPLKLLLKKLAAFERFCASGRFDVAAVVASDLRTVLANPHLRQVMPSFLSGYFQCLLRHGKQLQRELTDLATDSATKRLDLLAIQELYQTDVDLFLALVERDNS